MCIFCKIVAGEIPAKKVFENEKVLAFYDIQPQAKVHILVIPKCHFSSLEDMPKDKADYLTECFLAVPHIAKLAGLENGYRIVVNTGADAGQEVNHLHLHILGGEKLGGILAH